MNVIFYKATNNEKETIFEKNLPVDEIEYYIKYFLDKFKKEDEKRYVYKQSLDMIDDTLTLKYEFYIPTPLNKTRTVRSSFII